MYKLIATIAFVLLSSQSIADSKVTDKYKKKFKNDKEFSFALGLLNEEVKQKLDTINVDEAGARERLEYLVGLETDLEIIPPKSVKCSEREHIVDKLIFYYAPKTSRLIDLPKHTKDYIRLIVFACSK